MRGTLVIATACAAGCYQHGTWTAVDERAVWRGEATTARYDDQRLATWWDGDALVIEARTVPMCRAARHGERARTEERRDHLPRWATIVSGGVAAEGGATMLVGVGVGAAYKDLGGFAAQEIGVSAVIATIGMYLWLRPHERVERRTTIAGPIDDPGVGAACGPDAPWAGRDVVVDATVWPGTGEPQTVRTLAVTLDDQGRARLRGLAPPDAVRSVRVTDPVRAVSAQASGTERRCVPDCE